MRRVIFNRKGGVGKSSITCNLAALSAHRGRKTLVIDLDPQGNSTRYLLGEAARDVEADLADFFEQFLSVRLFPEAPTTFVTPTPFPHLHVMASAPALADLEGKLEAKYKIFKLRDALEDLGETYTDIYIDTPPAFNFYTRSALIAAQTCLIPFDCDDFSRQALYTLLDDVTELRTDHNPNLTVEGIIVNEFIARARLPQRLVADLEEEGLPLLTAHLSSSVKMRESHQQATPLIYLAPRHKLTGEYVALFEELEARMARPAGRRG